MAETITIRTASSTEVVKIAVQGPQGATGAGVPTGGSTGQVLRKASGANYDTEWAAAGSGSGSVTSVALASSDFTISGSPITDAGTITANLGNTGVTAGTYTKVTVDAKGRVTAGETATASDVGAQSTLAAVNVDSGLQTSPHQLAGMSAQSVRVATLVDFTIRLPQTNIQSGDIIEIRAATLSATKVISIQRDQANGGGAWTTIATIPSQGQKRRFVATGATANSWQEDLYFTTDGTLASPAVHTHAASEITSGTLTHERGGLEADVSAYNGLVKISGGSTSAVTVTAAGEALLDDATNADQRTTLGLGTAAVANLGTGASDAAYGNHTHSQLHDRSHAITSTSDHTAGNHKIFYSDGSGNIQELALGANDTFLKSNGATSAPSFAAASGGVGGGSGSVDNAIIRADGTGGSTVQSSDINILDASTSTQNNVAITNEHSGQTNSALVLCNKGTGAFIVSPARPDGTSTGGNARGSGAICIQTSRTAATQVASTTDSIAIGNRSTSSSSLGESVAIGPATTASGSYSTCVGGRATATGSYACAFGHDADATGASTAIAIGDRSLSSTVGGIAIGSQTSVTNDRSVCVGDSSSCTGQYSVTLGASASISSNYAVALGASISANLRGQFAARPFNAIYWSGQTTTNAATILNLDGTATNRFTIAASTALAVDILLVARRTGTQDKWLVARRFLGIRRDGSNNTSLIGTVQEVAPDQSAGSPTWTYAFTADDTNEALQCEVTGATGETVEWRVTAFYRVA